VHEEHLAAPRDLRPNGADQDGGVELHDVGLDGESILRRGLDYRHVANADEGHVQRTRNRRRRHGQDVDPLAHLLDAFLVRDTEPLFFVDNEQAEVLEVHVLGQQPVRADDDVEAS